MKIIKFAAISLGLLVAASNSMANTIRLSHHHAVNSAVDQTAKKFADIVSEKSDKKLRVRVFPGGQLGQEIEAFDILNRGGLEMTITAVSQMDRVFPAAAVTSLPFVFKDWNHATTAFSGQFGDELANGMRASSNAELLGYFGLGFRDMLFRGKPASTVQEMEGLRIRSPENTIWISMFESLGARPTPITWGEVYTALQTGVADGLDSPPNAAVDMKFYEVTKSLTRTRHMYSAMAFVINKATFQALPPEDQALIKQAAIEAGAWGDTEVGIPGEESAYSRLQDLGIAVVEAGNPDEWRAAVKPVWKIVSDRDDVSRQLLKLLTEQ